MPLQRARLDTVRVVDYPVILPVPGTSDHLLLTDYMEAVPGRGNLARVRDDGSEVWRAAPDLYSQDTWTMVRVEDGVCRASSWSCWDVTLDLETGQELGRVFTK